MLSNIHLQVPLGFITRKHIVRRSVIQLIIVIPWVLEKTVLSSVCVGLCWWTIPIFVAGFALLQMNSQLFDANSHFLLEFKHLFAIQSHCFIQCSIPTLHLCCVKCLHENIGEIIETPMFSMTKNNQSSWVISHVFYSVKSLFSHVLCMKIPWKKKLKLVHPSSLPDPFPGKSPWEIHGGFFWRFKEKNWDNSWSSWELIDQNDDYGISIPINHLWEFMILSYKIDGIVRRRF